MANASIFKLNTDQASKIAHVNRGTIVSWINHGILRATDVGDGPMRPRWEIDERDLKSAIEFRKYFNKFPKADEVEKLREEVKAGKVQMVGAQKLTEQTTTIPEENKDLVGESEDLIKENKDLVNENKDLLKENRDLRVEIDSLKSEIILLQSKIESLNAHSKQIVDRVLEALASTEN